MSCQHENLDGGKCTNASCDYCLHEVKFGGLCAVCGNVIQDEEESQVDQIKMTHKDTGITVSLNEAKRLEQQDAKRLLEARKLSLIVDLDQTILHATWEPSIADWVKERKETDSQSVKDIRQFTLDGSPLIYSIKLRPGLSEFLKDVSKKYEMHIYTMGTRSYAEAVVREIDPDGTLFQDRILSRDENGSMTKKRLERLFPSDTSKVVVLDDRGDVWDYSRNLIQIKPYEYFIGIGDINSPFAQPKKDIIPSAESLSKTIVHKQSSTTPHTNTSDEKNAANDREDPDHKDEANHKNGLNIKEEPIHKETSIHHQEDLNIKEEPNHEDESNHNEEPKHNGDPNHIVQANHKETHHNAEPKVKVETDESSIKQNDVNNNTAHAEKDKEDKDDTPAVKEEEGSQSVGTNSIEDTDSSSEKNHDEESADIYSDTEDDEENAPKYPPPKDDAVFKVPARIQKDTHLPNTHDADDTLRVIRKTLFDVHNIYFNDLLKRNQKPDVAIILNSLKRKVLRDVNVVFSGIIPLHQTRPEDSWIWRMATSFGANCFHELTGKVTHLIAANPGTDKALTARKHGNIKIVTPAWITDSVWNWERLNETDYLLPMADVTPPEPEIEDPESTLLEIEFDWEDDEVDEALGSDDEEDDEDQKNVEKTKEKAPSIPKQPEEDQDLDDLEEDELFRADMDAVLGEDMDEILGSDDDDDMPDSYDEDEYDMSDDEEGISLKREREDDDLNDERPYKH
ncbi:hypothetical protein INT47_004579 [Mucor saturninus]|uniref:RNA polymerase II subunit A C-terminal domain phosphatase n=1 Tax=Mucor saturninus TaxID=64648 RepID=A0A8H7RIZ3_9FUNG|nr:hypothetical protein INT47_004579 [Mucor saturninus]